jgi:hypothetical protein
MCRCFSSFADWKFFLERESLATLTFDLMMVDMASISEDLEGYLGFHEVIAIECNSLVIHGGVLEFG